MSCAISCARDAEKFRLWAPPRTALVNENKTARAKLHPEFTSADPMSSLHPSASLRRMRKKKKEVRVRSLLTRRTSELARAQHTPILRIWRFGVLRGLA